MQASIVLISVSALILLGCSAVDAFLLGSPSSGSGLVLNKALPTCVSSSRNLRRQGLALRMADIYEDDNEPQAAPKRVEGKKGGISDNMRAKLLRENQALGGDPDKASVNWVVVVSVIIASLAIVGNLFGAF